MHRWLLHMVLYRMPLKDIDAEWLDIMVFNGAYSPILGMIDLDAALLIEEALAEAPEASRDQIAARLEIVGAHLAAKLQAQSGTPPGIVEQMQGVVRTAILELKGDKDWMQRVAKHRR